MVSVLGTLSPVLALLAIVFLWLAIYFFRNIILMAERIERKNLGSFSILIALPLVLILPLVTSYYVFGAGMAPPPDVGAVCSALYLVGALLLFRPSIALVSMSGSARVPKLILFIYMLTYAIANLAQMRPFPLPYIAEQLIILAAQLVIGTGLILLSSYTSNFKELTVQIVGKKFSTRYELSALMLMAGVMLPMGATLMTTSIRETLLNGAESNPTIVLLYFLAHLMLAIAGLLAFVAMLVFKNVIEDFCFRLGSMDALVRRDMRSMKE